MKMKRFLILALLISVFSVSMSAQVSDVAWSKRYTSDMDPYAYITFYNSSPKTITTFESSINCYCLTGFVHTTNRVISGEVLPYERGYAQFILVVHKYEQPDYRWYITLKRVRYSDGTYSDLNISIPEK